MMRINSGLISLCFLTLIACATVVPPSGGPEDKTPPQVTAVYPAPNQVQVPTRLDVRIQFSEWIAQPLPRGSVRISPPLPGRLRTEVDGDLLSVTSSEPLDSAITYSLLISNAIRDLRGNSLARPYTLTFSTGPQLDTLKVSGWVHLPDSLRRSRNFPVIGLYPLGNIRQSRRYLKIAGLSDAREPILNREPALYVGQTDSAGRFTIQGIAPGSYRIAAFADVNQNNRIDIEQELAGTGEADLDISVSKDSVFLRLSVQDTNSPRLTGVQQIGNHFIRLQFSRTPFVDKNFQPENHCHLFGRDTLPRLSPISWWSLSDSAQLMLAFRESPPIDSVFLAGCSRPPYIRLRWENRRDSITPSLQKFSLVGPNPSLDSVPFFFAVYNAPIAADSVLPALRLVAGGDTLTATGRQRAANSWEARPAKPLPRGATVEVFQVIPDTTGSLMKTRWQLLGRFETINPLKTASLFGKIPGCDDRVVVRLQSYTDRSALLSRCDSAGAFYFPIASQGSYRLEYFRDLNGDGTPNAGSIHPYRPSEPWRFIADTLYLRGQDTLNSSFHIPSLPRNLP